MKKKQLVINIISNMLSFGLQMGISFLLTPIIVEKVGDAAYGFIGLANNFVSYASILTVAVNSMAGRFITFELSKGNQEKANKYFSSVFIMDIMLSILILIVSLIIIINLTFLLDIPSDLVIDVKITFILAFGNFILSLISTVFTISTFAKNRLELEAIRNIVSNIIKAIFLIIVFTSLAPKVYFISLSAVIYTLVVMLSSLKMTKKIAPELKIARKNFDINYVKTIVKSGIWNAINSLSRILLTGIDLLIANLFIGADAMGVLSIAKTIPNAIETLLGTLGNIFTPQFIMLYSKNKIRDLIKNVNFSIKVISFIMIVPMAGFIAFGEAFFTLWLPSKAQAEIFEIQILSILSLLPYVVSVNAYTLYSLDTVTNRLKRPVIATLIMSILSSITTIIVIKTTNLGIYAVAGVSTIYWCLKFLLFNPINAARNLRIKKTTFYPILIRSMITFLLICIGFMIVNSYVTIASWMTLFLVAILVGIIGYILVFLLLFNQEEKIKLGKFLKEKCKR